MAQVSSHQVRASDPTFVSLGMLVLDELRFLGKETLYDVPGGSGVYSTLGARLFQPGTRSRAVGCLLVAGSDFPSSVTQRLESWDIDLHVKKIPDKKSTRGLLEYEDETLGRKKFTYVTPPLQPQPDDLVSTSLLRAKVFHILATPQNLECYVSTLLSLRKEAGVLERPLIVWEPAPLSCDKKHLESHLQACKLVNVFSPNHLELSYLVDGKRDHDPPFDKQMIESHARRFLASADEEHQTRVVVVRCGEHGCAIVSQSGIEWLPTFYDPDSSKIVDATGAGNAFLGGLSIKLQESGDLRDACVCGSIAASFALEQFGLPELSCPHDCSEGERWNGADLFARLREFTARIAVG